MTTKSGAEPTKSTRKTTRKTPAKSAATRGPSTRKSTVAKTATSAKSTRRKAPAAAKVEPKLVTVTEPVISRPELRKKELIDRAVERSGLKKKDVKPAVDAILAELGEALAEGRELNLRPFGKLKVQRQEDKANGSVIICRVRQPRSIAPVDPDPVIEAAG